MSGQETRREILDRFELLARNAVESIRALDPAAFREVRSALTLVRNVKNEMLMRPDGPRYEESDLVWRHAPLYSPLAPHSRTQRESVRSWTDDSSGRTRDMLVMRLNGDTFGVIAKEYDLSLGRVGQIFHRTEKRMKEALRFNAIMDVGLERIHKHHSYFYGLEIEATHFGTFIRGSIFDMHLLDGNGEPTPRCKSWIKVAKRRR